MSALAPEVQPAFDTENVGASLVAIRAQLPIRSVWLAGTVFGEYTSRRLGAGYDPDGVRDYEIGDDPRHIDWYATARHPEEVVQLRQRHKDVTPTFWVVTDVLKNRANADTDQYYTKQQLGLSAVMGLMTVSDASRMRSGLIAADSSHLALRQKEPLHGRRHMYKTARALANIALNPSQVSGSEEHTRLTDLLNNVAKRSHENVVAIVSDFRDEAYQDGFSWEKPLRRLKRDGNDILAVQLTDPRDFYIKDEVEKVRDPETNVVLTIGHDRDGQRIRQTYRERAEAQAKAIDKALTGVAAHHIQLRTDDPRWRDTFRKGLQAKRRQ